MNEWRKPFRFMAPWRGRLCSGSASEQVTDSGRIFLAWIDCARGLDVRREPRSEAVADRDNASRGGLGLVRLDDDESFAQPDFPPIELGQLGESQPREGRNREGRDDFLVGFGEHGGDLARGVDADLRVPFRRGDIGDLEGEFAGMYFMRRAN
jgi:hypothetical protein